MAQQLAASRAARYLRLSRDANVAELTPGLLFELIKRIEIGQGTYEQTAQGKVKRQRICTRFRFLPEPYETELIG